MFLAYIDSEPESGIFASGADVIAALLIAAVVLFFVGRFAIRRWGRACPACGYRVPAGHFECRTCGHNFLREDD